VEGRAKKLADGSDACRKLGVALAVCSRGDGEIKFSAGGT